MPRMGKTEEDWKGLKLGFFKSVQPNSFLKLVPASCNLKNNAQETYVFVSDLWFCHLPVISLLDSDWGRVIDKINKTKWTGLPWHSSFYKVTVEPPLIAPSVQRLLYFFPGGQSIHWLLFKPALQRQRPLKFSTANLSTTASFFSDWWKSQEWSWNLIRMALC